MPSFYLSVGVLSGWFHIYFVFSKKFSQKNVVICTNKLDNPVVMLYDIKSECC